MPLLPTSLFAIRWPVIALAFLLVSRVALAVNDAPPVLEVTADIILNPPDKKTAMILLHLVNLSDHDVTVLTKSLEFAHWSIDTDKSGTYRCDVGYTSHGSKDGHLVVPSLNDLGPVTLRPNEEGIANYDLDDEDEVAAMIKSESRIELTYSVSDMWAKRLAVWGGTVKAKTVHLGSLSDKPESSKTDSSKN